MVELEYVRRRKRRKLVAIISSIASLGLGVLILVSFLGRFVGTFTVSLDSGTVRLSLARTSTFESPTSHMVIDKIKPFSPTTYQNIMDDVDRVDNENYDYTIGGDTNVSGEITRLNFFKYTYFIKNVGNISARYETVINITNNNSRDLDKILRVMVFENDVDLNHPEIVTHNKTVYALKSEVPNDVDISRIESPEDPSETDLVDGSTTYREFLSKKYVDLEGDEKMPGVGFAKQFVNNKVAASWPVKTLDSNQIKRYTIVIWLEGYDPQCTGEAPEGANLKLGVKINAYEK